MCEVKKHNVRTTSEGIGTEIHPFNNPDDLKSAKYLIVGTFPPHRFSTKKLQKNDVDWFYGSKDNRLWGENGIGGLLQSALGFENEVLDTKEKRTSFCKKQGIAFLDLFQVIKRYGNLSSDSNIFPIEIVNLVYYLEENPNIEIVLFTSSWVEQIARKEYLRINESKLPKNKKGEKQSSVEGGVFCRFGENKKPAKIRKLPSPSPTNSKAIKNKLIEWQKAFDRG